MSLEAVTQGIRDIANVDYDPVISSHEAENYFSVVLSVGFTGKELETLTAVYKIRELAPLSRNHKEGAIEVLIDKS